LLKALGEPCSSGDECQLGFCPPQDGVCCDSPCDAACASCSGAKTCGVDGYCEAIPSGANPDGECGQGAGCFAGSCQSGTVVFTTSGVYNGNLGGIAGADAICQSLAQNVCLTGTFLAWLGTAASAPASRFNHQAVPYRRVDGVVVANDWADLVDGAIANAIDLTESGAPAPEDNTGCPTARTVWSGVSQDGTSWGGGCADWQDGTDASGGQWGWIESLDMWSSWCSGGVCSWVAPFYCFQQP
jgi:hypothetical protein